MQIKIIPTYQHLSLIDLSGKIVVVVDVLRATSTIVTALANGAKNIIPVSNQKECFQTAKLFPASKVILGGEELCQKIKGFHLGNSPREYTADIIKDKIIVFTSTNGAQAIKAAAKADGILIGSLLNAKAIAKQLTTFQQDIVIVCSGTRGEFSLEDTFGAGMIIHYLLQRQAYKLTDLSYLAYKFFINNKNNLPQLFLHSRAGQTLKRLNCYLDIHFCGQMNLFSVIPFFQDNAITLG